MVHSNIMLLSSPPYTGKYGTVVAVSYYSINPVPHHTSYNLHVQLLLPTYYPALLPGYDGYNHTIRPPAPVWGMYILFIAPPFQKRVNRCMILCQKSLFNLSNYLPTGAKKQSYRGRNKNCFQNPSQVVLPLATVCLTQTIILVFMGDCSYLVKSLYLLLHKESICIKNAETVE